MCQNYTSANTSINTTKLPAVFNKVKFEKGSIVVDYGCGKMTEHIKEKLMREGVRYYGCDKYNQPEEKNKIAFEMLPKADYATCANVLNVIDDDDEVKNIIKLICSSVSNAIFQIYEGDGSGIGKVTKKDCYQRNQKRKYYENMIKGLGFTVTKATGNYIFCQNCQKGA